MPITIWQLKMDSLGDPKRLRRDGFDLASTLVSSGTPTWLRKVRADDETFSFDKSSIPHTYACAQSPDDLNHFQIGRFIERGSVQPGAWPGRTPSVVSPWESFEQVISNRCAWESLNYWDGQEQAWLSRRLERRYRHPSSDFL